MPQGIGAGLAEGMMVLLAAAAFGFIVLLTLVGGAIASLFMAVNLWFLVVVAVLLGLVAAIFAAKVLD